MEIKRSQIQAYGNPRFVFEGIEDLANSISEFGLLNPLIVIEKKEGTYLLIDGYRRLAALDKLGLDTIKVMVIDGSDNELKRAQVLGATQLFRHLQPIESALLAKDLMPKCDNVASQVARVMQVSPATITHWLRVASLPDDLIDAIKSGKLGFEKARSTLSRFDAQESIDKLRNFLDMQEAQSNQADFEEQEALEDVLSQMQPVSPKSKTTFESVFKDGALGIELLSELGTDTDLDFSPIGAGAALPRFELSESEKMEFQIFGVSPKFFEILSYLCDYEKDKDAEKLAAAVNRLFV